MEVQKKEKGFVLVMVAFFLVALLGFAALAVDIGVLYGAKTSAQEVADAAALAGAFTFINNPTAPQPASVRPVGDSRARLPRALIQGI